MKFILLSDLHLLWQNPEARLDNLVESQFSKLEFVWSYAKEIGATILQAGDWHNTPRGYGLLSKEIDLLNKYKVDSFSIFGQHDTYFYSEETRNATSLGILEKAGLVSILGNSSLKLLDDRRTIQICGVSYGQDIPEISMGADLNILVIHAPIAEKALWSGHDYMDARKFSDEHSKFDLILCGDIHKKFCIEEDGQIICNTGCMIRKSVDLWNHTPCFYVYDTKKKLGRIEEVEIPHQPPEVVLSREHLEKEERVTAMLDKFVQEMMEVNPDMKADTTSFNINLQAFIKENKVDQEIVNILSQIMSKEG